tara:strand:- start:2322 stop:2540 length:219 start_codon:yes stop_codon:yes gene_type:complete
MSYMDRIEKLISDSGRASLTLGNVLIAAYNVAKENEDKMLAKMLIEVLGKKNDFDKTMIKLIEYLEKRKDME